MIHLKKILNHLKDKVSKTPSQFYERVFPVAEAF